MNCWRRWIAGFALLPVVFTLTLLAVATAVLLERGGVENGIGDARQRSDALAYAAEAGYAHAAALLGRWSGCSGLPALPPSAFAQSTYTVTLTGGAPAPGTSYSFASAADSWLESSKPADNHGTDNDLRTKNKASDHRQPVLRFDFTGLPANIDIASATLHLYVKNDDHTGLPVEVYRVTNAWTEATVTWSNANGQYDPALLYAAFFPATNGPLAVDLTRLVRAWVAGAIPNDGVRLIAKAVDEESVYAGREEGDPTKRPRIEIVARPRIDVAVTAVATSADGVERTVAGSASGPANGALFLDYFDAAFAGNDGSRDWTGNWQEIGESNGAGAGAVRVVASSTCAHGNCLRLDAGLLSSAGAWRALNLQGASGAVLRVDTRRDGGNWTLQVSGNGGSTWHTLKTVGSGNDAKQVSDSFNVSAYATANMRVKVTSSQLLSLGSKDVYVDNVEVEAVCGP